MVKIVLGQFGRRPQRLFAFTYFNFGVICCWSAMAIITVAFLIFSVVVMLLFAITTQLALHNILTDIRIGAIFIQQLLLLPL